MSLKQRYAKINGRRKALTGAQDTLQLIINSVKEMKFCLVNEKVNVSKIHKWNCLSHFDEKNM